MKGTRDALWSAWQHAFSGRAGRGSRVSGRACGGCAGGRRALAWQQARKQERRLKDRSNVAFATVPAWTCGLWSGMLNRIARAYGSVSYTHLTLPTICSV
eukprot:5003383-Alexandrium_andersonii.AAC.1